MLRSCVGTSVNEYLTDMCNVDRCTWVGKKAPARFRECFRQVLAEVVSKSSNKIHQTWAKPFSRALYMDGKNIMFMYQ